MDQFRGPEDIIWIEDDSVVTAAIEAEGAPDIQAEAKARQEGVQPLPEAFTALPESKRGVCAGGCDRPTVRRQTWKNEPGEAKKEMRSAGIVPTKGRGLCEKCYEKARAEGRLGEYPTDDWRDNPQSQFLRTIPPIWEEIRKAGGGYPELAEALGETEQQAWHHVNYLGLPKAPPRTAYWRERQEWQQFAEELDRFLMFGLGIHEIAQAFHLTDKELIEKVDRLRDNGITQHNLNYHDRLEIAA